jgi:hypothetical protein
MDNLHAKYRWMRWLSDPILRQDSTLKGIILEPERKITVAPMSLSDGEQRWGFASNKAALILVRGHIEWNEMEEPQAGIIRGFIRKPIDTKRVDFGEFKRWLGTGWSASLPCLDCEADWAITCSSCLGLGKVGKSCGSCGDGHKCKCLACNGNGVLYCQRCTGGRAFAKRPGRIGKTLVDMSLLARFLAHVEVAPHAQVRIMNDGPYSPIWIEPTEKNWRVVAMPMRDTPVAEKELPTWPN